MFVSSPRRVLGPGWTRSNSRALPKPGPRDRAAQKRVEHSGDYGRRRDWCRGASHGKVGLT